MGVVYVDPQVSDLEVRKLLYQGHLVLLTKLSPVADFVEFAREQLETLFAPHDPRQAHLHCSPAELAKTLGKWKPSFIHNVKSKAFVKAIVAAAGFDPGETFYDVPKPRTAYPVGHLTTGIAFAFPWHRDTWYAAPAQQLNWWFPIYEIVPENAMKFDAHSFARPVENDSAGFDSYRANRERLTVADRVGKDERSRPGALNHVAAEDLIVLPSPGQILLFSGAHLHSSIPNTSGVSRYSIDFRTVDRRDVLSGVGAPMVDVNCSGTALRDFAAVSTDERLPEDLITKIAGPPPEGAILVFDESLADTSAKLIS